MFFFQFIPNFLSLTWNRSQCVEKDSGLQYKEDAIGALQTRPLVTDFGRNLNARVNARSNPAHIYWLSRGIVCQPESPISSFYGSKNGSTDSSRIQWIYFLERLAAEGHDPGDTWVQVVGGEESRFLDTAKGIDPLLEGQISVLVVSQAGNQILILDDPFAAFARGPGNDLLPGQI
jgi:hypothetical protein